MSKQSISSGSSELNQIISDLNQEGGFTLTLLTDSQGLAIASASKNGSDPELHSAVIAQVQKTISQAGQRLGLTQTEEISIFTQDGQRLICRFFTINNDHFILAITTPDREQKYRRLTNQAISHICQLWSKLSLGSKSNGHAR